MELKHALVVGGSMLKHGADNWFILTTVLGAAAFFVSLLPNIPYQTPIRGLSGMVVFSSVFASFTRYLSVHKIIKKELLAILYGDEHLGNPTNFDGLWNKLVGRSIKDYMPALETHLHGKALREYLPGPEELFYKSYRSTLDVRRDEANPRVIRVTETTSVTVVTRTTSKHSMPYHFTGPLPDGMNLEYRTLTLKNGEDDCLHLVEESVIEPSSGRRKKISYTLTLEGKTEYEVYRKSIRDICLDMEPFVAVVSGRHTLCPEVTVSCQGVKAHFTSTGTLDEFKVIDGQNNSTFVHERYPALMLKRQGYVVYFAG